MNDLKVEPQGYTDHPTPIQIHLSQHEGKFLKCSAPDLAPSTGPTFSPSMVGFDAKFHQRIIVKEVGYPLHDEESITTVFKSARDAAEGHYKRLVPHTKFDNNIFLVLEFMSKNELVHRNVSSGNILIVDGKGKLVDLEYAQIIGAGGCHGVRTVGHHFLLFSNRLYASGNNCLHGCGGRNRRVLLHCRTISGSLGPTL